METALSHPGHTDPDSGPGHSDHRKRSQEEGCRVVLKEKGGAWWPGPAAGWPPCWLHTSVGRERVWPKHPL